MKHVTLFLSAMLLATLSFAQVDITFRVDMSNETVSADGVHVAGDLNGWSTTDNQLTDQGGGIYMTTVSLDPGRDIQYKYLNGNAWGTEESAPANCTVGGNNRIFTVPATSDTLDLVPFNGCPDVVEKRQVTFRVDMTNETPSGDGVHVAGNFVGWDPGVAMMTDMGDGIYEYQADVLASILTVQYKYVNGNAWGNEESIPDGCKNGDSNRFAPVSGATNTLPTYVFGTCDTVASATNSIDGDLAAMVENLWVDQESRTLHVGFALGIRPEGFRVMDLQGRVLNRGDFPVGGTRSGLEIGMTCLPDGVYLLQVVTSEGLISKRFLLR